MQVKALACELELPSLHGLPLARWSQAELARYVQESGLVGTISGSTIWRWLSKDAIRPWQHRSCRFPRDPRFAQKAAPVLDLYQRCWEGQPLHHDELVISADEKTSIQARRRTPMPPYLPAPAAPCASNTNTNAAVPGPTSQPSTYTASTWSGAVRPKPESCTSVA